MFLSVLGSQSVSVSLLAAALVSQSAPVPVSRLVPVLPLVLAPVSQ